VNRRLHDTRPPVLQTAGHGVTALLVTFITLVLILMGHGL
jgi:hypothetical protein